MAYRQDQKNSQKQRVSLSSQLIEAVTANEKSDLEIQDELDLERLTDAELEEAPSELNDDENVPDIDEDGRVNEDIEWDSYLPKDDTNSIERELRQKLLPPEERDPSKEMRLIFEAFGKRPLMQMLGGNPRRICDAASKYNSKCDTLSDLEQLVVSLTLINSV